MRGNLADVRRQLDQLFDSPVAYVAERPYLPGIGGGIQRRSRRQRRAYIAPAGRCRKSGWRGGLSRRWGRGRQCIAGCQSRAAVQIGRLATAIRAGWRVGGRVGRGWRRRRALDDVGIAALALRCRGRRRGWRRARRFVADLFITTVPLLHLIAQAAHQIAPPVCGVGLRKVGLDIEHGAAQRAGHEVSHHGQGAA